MKRSAVSGKSVFVALTIILWFTAGFPRSLKAQNKSFVQITTHHQTLGNILDEFQKQSGIQLAYVNSMVDSIRVFKRIKDKPENALRKILAGTSFDFIIRHTDLWVIVPRRETLHLPSYFSGIILDAKDNQPVEGVNVFIAGTRFHATTNSSGNFEIGQIPPGNYNVSVKRIGYKDENLELIFPGNRKKHLELALKPQPITLKGFTITDISLIDVADHLSSEQKITENELTLPPLINDGEILEILHQQPGISRHNPFDVFPHIEGGSATEVSIELDGMPVFVPTYGQNHRSVFAAPIIKGITLHRSGYSVQHGEAMSGVVELHSQTIEDIPYKAHMGVSLSGISLSAVKKTSRVGWLGMWRTANNDKIFNLSSFNSHDVFNKLEYNIEDHKKLTFLGLITRGAFTRSNSYQTPGLLSHNLGVRYTHHFDASQNLSSLFYSSVLENHQREIGLKIDARKDITKILAGYLGVHIFELETQGSAVWDELGEYKYIPGDVILKLGDIYPSLDSLTSTSADAILLQKAAVMMPYIGFNVDHKFWGGQMGLRIPANLEDRIARMEPRIKLALKPQKNINISVSGGRYHQFTDRSYATEIKSGDNIGSGEYLVRMISSQPSRADHYRGELSYRISSKWIISTAVFKKKYHFTDRGYLARINENIWMIPLNRGESYGTEMWIGKKIGSSQGWISYTINHGKYTTEGGTEFRPYFDRKRILNISFTQPLSSYWQFKWHFSRYSGFPFREWGPDQIKIDPFMFPEAFAQQYLPHNGNSGSQTQLVLGLNRLLVKPGKKEYAVINLVAMNTNEESNTDRLERKYKFWISLRVFL